MNRSKGSAMLFLVVLVFAVGAMSLPAESAAWPERRIELICHSQAGASGDIFLRALAKFIEKKTGVPVIVNNVTGGSGANAWSRTLRARADGYTILGVSSTLIGSPLQNNIPINYTSFDPIARMFIDAVTNYVSAESPYKTLSDF
ncbi:MAG: hypothetical protein LBQ42_00260, partial [Synergistaceae bacterium]|nr:hypothetical protein [Synergistaceae bacterium]